jgi:hypothetical protein
MSTETMQASDERPGVVTFIGVILYIQAFMALIATITLLIWRSDILDYLEQDGSPVTDGTYTGMIVSEGIITVLLLAVANGIMRGSRGYRDFVAVVQGLSMGFAVWVIIVHHGGGYGFRGVFSLFVGVFVLWALYGNEQSARFFARR